MKASVILLLISLLDPVCCLLAVEPSEVLLSNSLRQARSNSSTPPTDITFSCCELTVNEEICPSPQTDITWLKNGVPVEVNSTKYSTLNKTRQLRILNPEETDMGLYECVQQQNDTQRGEAVLLIAPIVASAPQIQLLQLPGDQTVLCSVSAGIRTVVWTKQGRLIASLNKSSAAAEVYPDKYVVLFDGSLRIKNASEEDAGVYRCFVYNKAGNDSMEIELIQKAVNMAETPELEGCVEITDYRYGQSVAVVLQPLSILSRLQDGAPFIQTASPTCVHAVEGYSIILNCTATGQPPLTISWENSSAPVDADARRARILGDGSLLISELQLSDSGNYTCIAQNNMNIDRWNITLTVQATSTVCGIQNNSTSVSGRSSSRKRRITGGQITQGWPWQVLLEFQGKQYASQDDSFCGGALIRPDWVLTAAHCVKSVNPGDILLRAGVFNRLLKEDSQQLLPVKAIHIHKNYPYYATANGNFDIALLKLTKPALLNKHVGLVCLPTSAEDLSDQTICMVTGWGHHTYGSKRSSELLHEASVPIVSYSECQRAYVYMQSNWLCAGYQQGGPDACQNDSGGPLVCRREGRWTEYGLVRSGDGCGKPGKYGIYMNVRNFVSWISDTVAKNV